MKLIRCNRCGREDEMVLVDQDALVPRMMWFTLALSETMFQPNTTTDVTRYDICAPCRDVIQKMLESQPGDSVEMNEFITRGAARLKATMNAERDAEADPDDIRERKCTECGAWIKRYGMAVHMRQEHPQPEDDSCCGCGEGPVTYRNYRQQPFCGKCVDGEEVKGHPDDGAGTFMETGPIGRIDDEPIRVPLCPGCKCLEHGDDLCKSAPNCLCRGPKEVSELQDKLKDMTHRVRMAGEGFVEQKYHLDKVKPNRFESTNMEVCSGCSHMPHSRGGCVSESRHGGICECRVHLGIKLVPLQRNGGHERTEDV